MSHSTKNICNVNPILSSVCMFGTKSCDVIHDPIGTESRVCVDIAKRQRLGMSKYGTTVEQNLRDKRETLQHAYEEALDLAIYLKRAIELFDAESADRSEWAERGARLRIWRRLEGLTLVDVAGQFGLTVKDVSKMERGEICPIPTPG